MMTGGSGPADQSEIQHRTSERSFVVISYDIPDDRRRLKVAHTLSGYGERVQKSVFECVLAAADYQRLRERLSRLIDVEQDNLRFYHLCGACRPRVEAIGRVGVTEVPNVYIV